MPRHVKSAKDLVTTRKATCQGFLDQAKVKTERAAPYVDRAMLFWEALQKAETPAGVLANAELREELISAAGISAKARLHDK